MNQFQGDTAALRAFATERQDTRLLRLRFPKGDAPAGALMLANTLDADEGLARDYVWTVVVLSDSSTVRHEDVLGKMVCIELVREDATLRYFNGYVTGFRLLGTDGGFVSYEMTVGPWLAFLRLRQDNAAFHDVNGVDMTGKVFDQYLRRDWRHRLTGQDPLVTYTCQYNESDHNFLHRQWEERGWFYRYEHRADGHTLILSDNSVMTAAPIEGARKDMPYQDQAGTMEDDGIHRWRPAQQVGSDRTTLASFNFKHPLPARVERTAFAGAAPDSYAEVYENTGMYGFRNFNDGEALTQLRIEEIEARRRQYTASGNDRTAEPGRWFTLSGHFGDGSAADPQRKYLITSVRHYATNNYQDGHGAVSHYRNDIDCIVQSIPWRPGRGFHSVTPRIYGVQTALVVGPPGEEIYTDGYGRIKIQFHWDRRGKFNDRSSPWVRVASSWAGPRFGHISLPRIGMEVVVVFLDGNVNRPLIVGCVYNATNMPPWELPANKTQSGILTRSSKEGRAAHANALRFEDKRGAEELWLHAEKDQRIEVEHDESHWVGNDRSTTVDRDENARVRRNRTERVDGNEKLTVGGNQTERIIQAKEESIGLGKALSIGGIYQLSVGAAMNTSVGMSQTAHVAANKHTRIGRSYTIDAGDEFTIQVGASTFQMCSNGSILISGNSIDIESVGPVTINGKDVDINPGGSRRSVSKPSGDADATMHSNETDDGDCIETDESQEVLRPEITKHTSSAEAAPSSAGEGLAVTESIRPSISKSADIEAVPSVSAAPEKISFSAGMQKQFDSLWEKSLQDGKALEHGGSIVADSEGNLSLINENSGKSGSFKPNYDVPNTSKMMGIFHTHPISADQGGVTGISFSGADAAVTVNNNENTLMMAQSGDEQFAFLRTQQSPPRTDYDLAVKLGNDRIDELMETQNMDFPTASKMAAREIGKHLHLAYYEGKNGVLTKVSEPAY